MPARPGSEWSSTPSWPRPAAATEMRTQICPARTVAEVIAEVATSEGDPAEIVEIAGPREEDLGQLAAMLVARRGTPVKAQAVRNPADPDADMQATGGLLPGPGGTAGRSDVPGVARPAVIFMAELAATQFLATSAR